HERTRKNSSDPSLSREQQHQEQSIEHEPLPPFSERYGEVDFNQDGFGTKARVASRRSYESHQISLTFLDDGRIDIKIHQQSQKLSDLLVPALRSQLDLQQDIESVIPVRDHRRPIAGGIPDQAPSPPLNVVIHVVGSRGDVQPFVSLGKVLKEKYNHRIRLATHPTFRSFVEENGLEFFSIGGDPAELMAFMVKNPGLMPGIDSLRSGDVGKRRKGMYGIIQGCWRSCIEAGDGTGADALDDQLNSLHSSQRSLERNHPTAATPAKPFVADAIIANPPSFAGIHCAEKLGIPLHLMFTTGALIMRQDAMVPNTSVSASVGQYPVFKCRSKRYELYVLCSGRVDDVARLGGYHQSISRKKPWVGAGEPNVGPRSPALIPKPKDWGSHISVVGFYFLSLASQFSPEPDLATFLEAGPPPIYIGFGSIVVDDPNGMTSLIFETVKKSGQRALVSKGWGGLGSDDLEIPNNVFMLGNVPHDWLFQHVSCVIHHGGAGTTAAGIAAGKPTVVVPFFGDQPFWGSMVAKAGAGPWPIPYKQLTSENLAAAISEALQPEALRKARRLGSSISTESGAERGAADFQNKIDVDSLRCSVSPGRAAAWRVRRTNIRLSTFAATVLQREGLLDFDDLKLSVSTYIPLSAGANKGSRYRPREYDAEDGPWDPITGATSAIMGTIGSMMMGIADLPTEILRALHIKPSHQSPAEGGLQTSSHSIPVDARSDSHKPSTPVAANVDDESILPNSSESSSITCSTASALQSSQPVSTQSLEPTKWNTAENASKPSEPRSNGSAMDWSRGKSMAQSLCNSASRPSSPARFSIDSSNRRSLSESPSGIVSLDTAVDTGKGIGRIVGAGLKSPMDFTLSLARGFHNAPKLYGDDMVRHPDKVTGIRSGFKAAGKEFGYGMYDGVSGIFTQPVHGAKQNGFGGFIKGVGKGIGGLLLKPQAAFFSLPAYAMTGIYKELQKRVGSGVQNHIMAARIAQGYEDLASSSQQERLDVVKRWQFTQVELLKEKQQLRDSHLNPPECIFFRVKNAGHCRLEENRKHSGNGKAHMHAMDGSLASKKSASTSTMSRPSALGDHLAHADTSTFEDAIQQSVEATSRGDPHEDAMIERAIRASVLELRAASEKGNGNQAIQRAIKASVAEAAQARAAMISSNETAAHVSDDDLHLALQQSLSMHPSAENTGIDASGDSEADMDDVAAVTNAPERSDMRQDDPSIHNTQLQNVMEQSRLAYEQRLKDLEKKQRDEEIVLDYVRKQSLLEEEHRRSLNS
ncbi:MAG: hypothetical protein Q9216_005294, partial [Gyalolechia sp. 2 TL-2023]